MSEALYERYKDALRRGHVAALRGRHDAALAAYVEAATIAPERALPHSSIGSIYLRLERPAEALTAFGHALDRSPTDETALAGRADTLVALGRPAEAAEALDRLSSVQDGARRPADALDSARRALELAESRARRRTVEALVERLRATVLDPPGEAVVARAVALLERSAVAAPAPVEQAGGADAALAVPTAAGALAPEPEPEPDPLALVVEADAAIEAGDTAAGRAHLLAAAGLLERSGRPDAALDACYEALALAPDDPQLHLTLAGLYLDRGWQALAADKLALLARMADLAGDSSTGESARQLVRARLADDPRVRDLLA